MLITRLRRYHQLRSSSYLRIMANEDQMSNGDQLLKAVRKVVNENIGNEHFTVLHLAKEIGLSRSALHRNLIKLTGKTPSDLIMEIRLARAMEYLENHSVTISEIAYKVGFTSPSYFNKVFKKAYHITPGELRKKGHGMLKHPASISTFGTESTGWLKNPRISKQTRLVIYLGLAFLAFAVIVVLSIVVRTYRLNESKDIDKSIAVLPFKYLSDEPDKQYQADGVMDAILLHLSKIKDLRVISRQTVEQFRDTDKSISEICEELSVGYALEGSFQKSENQIRLIVQLIQTGTERHVWAKNYDREWKEIFTVQSEVAQAVARELQAVITPQEQQRIEKIPTTDLTAYDFYMRGMKELKYGNIHKAEDIFGGLMEQEYGNIHRAEDLLHNALSYDSTFAGAYVGLARVFRCKQDPLDYYSENYLDSVRILANIALTYDRNLSEAYSERAYYYHLSGKPNLALEDLENAINLNPNNPDAYSIMGDIYYSSNILEYIKAMHKLLGIDRTGNLNIRFKRLAQSYNLAGFANKMYYYENEALKLDGDSADYYDRISVTEYWLGNLNRTIELCGKSLAIDSTRSRPYLFLARSLCDLGSCREAKEFMVRYINLMEEYGYLITGNSRIAYIYWKNGLKEEAEYHFNQEVKILEQEINLNRPRAQKLYAYYDLAGIYAFKGYKEKSLENLRIFNQIEQAPFWLVALINRDQLFDSIRNEPEFQQIVRDVEAKYQAEHERVRQWLEENDML